MYLIFGFSSQLSCDGECNQTQSTGSYFLVLTHCFPLFHEHPANLADKVNIEGVYSITQTLEKWGNDIFWQMKHTLLNNPNALLPEFSR